MKHWDSTAKLRWLRGLIGGVVALTPGLLAAPVLASTTNGTCQNVSLNVALGAGLPANQTLAGTVCVPNTWAAGTHDIDILVHGATYNRSYWDWPQGSTTYSYVDRTLAAGRATFAFDEIGAGQSSHPLSTALTPAAVGYVMHEAVQWARGQGYPAVTAVGHSFGSVTVIHEAATYHDVDRVVITGLLHANGLKAITGVTDFYPAPLDPQFILSGFDLGYLTTIPGTRAAFFYDTATADPAVIAYDEAHKDVFSATQLALGLTEFEVPAGLNIAAGITAPVLSISGQEDAITCGVTLDCTNAAAVQANETAYYTHASSVSTSTVANTGHDINLHPSAASSFATINAWITTH